jgi:hypothetical protein
MVVKATWEADADQPDRVGTVRIARYTTGEDPTYGIVE